MKTPVVSVDETRPWSEAEAEYEGYAPWYNAIDFNIATKCVCPKCGLPMNYEGFENNGSRHSLAVCYSCDLSAEF